MRHATINALLLLVLELGPWAPENGCSPHCTSLLSAAVPLTPEEQLQADLAALTKRVSNLQGWVIVIGSVLAMTIVVVWVSVSSIFSILDRHLELLQKLTDRVLR